MISQYQKEAIFRIESQYNGPPDSGNGGYTCGRIANYFSDAAEVTLLRPAPLDKDLTLRFNDKSGILMYENTEVAKVACKDFHMEIPQCPTWEETLEATKQYISEEKHLLPTCYVCGPKRTHDGLAIYPAQVRASNLVAAPWRTKPDYQDEQRAVKKEIIWAALDCPGYFGLMNTSMLALLGRMSTKIYEQPLAGEELIITGWKIQSEGRKFFAGTGLFNKTGKILACSTQVWLKIEK